MDETEFRRMRKSLNLAPRELADILAWYGIDADEAMVKIWESGKRKPIPAEVCDCLLDLDHDVETMAQEAIQTYLEHLDELGYGKLIVTLVSYAKEEDCDQGRGGPDGQPHPHRLHGAGLQRIMEFANDAGVLHAFSTVVFDRASFDSFCREHRLQDNSATRSSWATWYFYNNKNMPQTQQSPKKHLTEKELAFILRGRQLLNFDKLKKNLPPHVRKGYNKNVIRSLPDREVILSYIQDVQSGEFYVTYEEAIQLARESSTYEEWWGRVQSAYQNKSKGD